MKFFMPVYAVALTLAVSANMFEQASAASCDATALACTATTCPTIGVQAATAVTKASAEAAFTTSCAQGSFAYVKALNIIADNNNLPLVEVRGSKTAAAVDPSSAALSSTTTPCANSYVNYGKLDAAADVKLSISCTAACSYRYKVEYGCQQLPCDVTATAYACSDTTVCPAVTTANPATDPTTVSLAKPATTTCATGKFAYLSKLTVFPSTSGTATKADDIVVQMTMDGTAVDSSTAAAVKDAYPGCSNTYTDLGKKATKDVLATIGCAASTTCNFRYKAEWMCQAADPTPAPTPKSGVAGVCPVAAWGTALVAAVAGANFAAPL